MVSTVDGCTALERGLAVVCFVRGLWEDCDVDGELEDVGKGAAMALWERPGSSGAGRTSCDKKLVNIPMLDQLCLL